MRHPWSIARRIAVVHVALVAAIALFSVWSAYLQAREVAQRVEERHVQGVTTLVARDPALVSALRAGDAPALQAGIDGWIAEAQVSWLTVMDPDGMRLASWRPEQVGVRYPKPVDAVVAGDTVVELSSTGAAGRSVRALAPVVDPEDGTVLGVVTTGVQISDVAIMAQAQIPGILLGSAAVAAVGLLVAWLVGRYLNRVTLGRGPEQIAEQFLLAETAMDSLEAGVVVLAPDGRARLHNDAAARLLGWEGAGEPRRRRAGPRGAAACRAGARPFRPRRVGPADGPRRGRPRGRDHRPGGIARARPARPHRPAAARRRAHRGAYPDHGAARADARARQPAAHRPRPRGVGPAGGGPGRAVPPRRGRGGLRRRPRRPARREGRPGA
ncbi:cache domain-containing protein [Micrococcus sp. R8502A1]|uniref:cache domain-containing protein n=1 Tax=Micrococcus sp. R8502A1 TaxID=2583239 RepID=UPI002105042C|nr:cache domain-containing protein [Micrococcus sp. R8502A1]